MKLIDKILDKTIIFSFDSFGYKRHKKYFSSDTNVTSLRGKVCIVTGASNGIGLYTAEKLAKKGARVYLLCRDQKKGEVVVSNIVAQGYNAILEIVDMSESLSVKSFLDRFKEKKVDVLIHNAGLISEKNIYTNDDIELTFATHLLGPHILTRGLSEKLKGGRVIWVTSGGMYLKKFVLSDAINKSSKYDGLSAYAITKRGQVILSDLWSGKLLSSGVDVNSMHPGWVDTPGLRNYLPGFTKLFNKRLRSVPEGADTIIWLASESSKIIGSGKFWFDRNNVKKNIWFIKERVEEKHALWDFCEKFK